MVWEPGGRAQRSRPDTKDRGLPHYYLKQYQNEGISKKKKGRNRRANPTITAYLPDNG